MGLRNVLGDPEEETDNDERRLEVRSDMFVKFVQILSTRIKQMLNHARVLKHLPSLVLDQMQAVWRRSQ